MATLIGFARRVASGKIPLHFASVRSLQTSSAIAAKKNKSAPPSGPVVNSGTYAYVLKDVTKLVDSRRVIFKDISLSFYHGSKIGVIGNNGCGKSTLMKIIAGLDKDFSGEAFAAPNRTVGYLSQEPQLDGSKNVFENVMDGLKHKKDLLDRYDELSAKMGDEGADIDQIMEEQGEIQAKIDAMDCWNLQRDVEIAMDALRCPPGESSVVNLSGGEKRRIALCRLLLEQPDILVLDEPTNHLDAESVQWLERFLQEYKGTLLLVTHDRYFLDNVVQWILEIDRGSLFPFKGSYSLWLEKKKERLELEKKQESSMSKLLERELEWIRQTPGARRKKNKARLDRYEELMEKSKTANYTSNQIVIPPGPRLGDQVIDFNNVSFSIGDRLLMDNVSFKLPRGAILGIIGPNGSGKTTLFKLVANEIEPASGVIELGKTVKLGYVSQSRHTLDNTKTVFQEISNGLDYFELGNGQKVNTRAFIATFNFRGPAQERMVGNLSGGERNRLHLAKMLREGCNLLMLDEPTNDLDVDTLRSLEEALPEFPGCVMVISHDRWFLNRVCTHILAFEGNSEVVFFEGNYSDYEADRVQRVGNQRPSRIKYKKAILSS